MPSAFLRVPVVGDYTRTIISLKEQCSTRLACLGNIRTDVLGFTGAADKTCSNKNHNEPDLHDTPSCSAQSRAC